MVNCLFVYSENALVRGAEVRPRIVITADPELDDNNSMIRFLLYSSDVDVEATYLYTRAVGIIGREMGKEPCGMFPDVNMRDSDWTHVLVPAGGGHRMNALLMMLLKPMGKYIRI